MAFGRAIWSSERRKRKKVVFIVVFMMVIQTTHSFAGFSVDDRCLTSDACTELPWVEPYPTCKMFRCSCGNSSCVHYTLDDRRFINYFCGECGVLGSSCTNDSECNFPSSSCSSNGYCMCDTGSLHYDICIHTQPVSISRETIILIFTLIGILVLTKLISSWSFVKKLFLKIFSYHRCSVCRDNDDSDGETFYGFNPESGSKSAAFTISSREFLVSSDDPDLQLALELSVRTPEDAFGVAVNDSSATGSFSRSSSRRSGTSASSRDNQSTGHSRQSFSSSSSSSNQSHVRQSFVWTTHSGDSSSHSSPFTTPSGTLRRSRRKRDFQSHRFFSHSSSRELILRPRSSSDSSESFSVSPHSSLPLRYSLPSGRRQIESIQRPGCSQTSDNGVMSTCHFGGSTMVEYSRLRASNSSYSSTRSFLSRPSNQSIRSNNSNLSRVDVNCDCSPQEETERKLGGSA